MTGFLGVEESIPDVALVPVGTVGEGDYECAITGFGDPDSGHQDSFAAEAGNRDGRRDCRESGHALQDTGDDGH
jgi:hypothetical protein